MDKTVDFFVLGISWSWSVHSLRMKSKPLGRGWPLSKSLLPHRSVTGPFAFPHLLPHSSHPEWTWKSLAGWKRLRHSGYLGQLVGICLYYSIQGDKEAHSTASASGQSGSVDSWNIIHAVQMESSIPGLWRTKAKSSCLHLPSQHLSLPTYSVFDSLLSFFWFCLISVPHSFWNSNSLSLSLSCVVKSGYSTSGTVSLGLWVKDSCLVEPAES